MKINFQKLADAIGMEIEQYHEYQYFRLQAVEAELKRSKRTLIEISEASTKQALNINIALDDEVHK